MTYIFNKNYIIILVILISIFLISACDGLENEDNPDIAYLDIGINNINGAEIIEPGIGRFVYDVGSIAEINFEETRGYEFIEWQGKDADKIVKESENKYLIKMNNDSGIKIYVTLEEFLPLSIIFDENLEIDYLNKDQITSIPHNISNIDIKFNNYINEANEISAEVINPKNNSVIIELSPYEVDIKDNYVKLIFYEGVFIDTADISDNFNFGDEYIIKLKQINKENIFDINLKEVKEDIQFSFKVEEPFPETPAKLYAEIVDNGVEISWLHCVENAKVITNDYVSRYTIYKYINKSSYNEDNYDEKIDLYIEDPNNTKIIRVLDANIDLANNFYVYRVQSINDYGNVSHLSPSVSIGQN